MKYDLYCFPPEVTNLLFTMQVTDKISIIILKVTQFASINKNRSIRSVSKFCIIKIPILFCVYLSEWKDGTASGFKPS